MKRSFLVASTVLLIFNFNQSVKAQQNPPQTVQPQKKTVFIQSYDYKGLNNFKDYKNLKIKSIDVSSRNVIFKLEAKENVSGFKVFKYISPFKLNETNAFIEPNDCSISFVRERSKEDVKKISFIKNLEESLSDKKANIKAVNTTMELIELLKLKNPKVSDIDDIKIYYTRLAKDKNSLEKQIKKLEKNLNEKLNNTNLIEVGVFCPNRTAATLKFFSFSELKSSQGYVVKVDTKDKKLFIEKHLQFVAPMDLENISLKYYPPITRFKPSYFEPFYVSFREEPERVYMGTIGAPPPRTVNAGIKLTMEEEKPTEREYEEQGTKAIFKVKNISVKKNQQVDVILSRDKYNVDIYIYVDAYGSKLPYMIAEILPFKNYPYLKNALFFVNDMFIATTDLEELKKGKRAKIYFGEDNLTFFNKKLIDEKYLEDKKTAKYEYKIQNLHKIPIRFVIDESVPVETEDVKVEIKSSKKWKLYDRKKGLVEWEFNLNPNDEIVFQLEYKAEKR